MVVADFIVTIHAGSAGTAAVEQVSAAAADTRAEAATVALSKNRDKAGIAATHDPLLVQPKLDGIRASVVVARAPRVPWELVHPSTAERTK